MRRRFCGNPPKITRPELLDTGNNQPETRNILKDIQAVTKQPVRYVIITQNHGDHIGGTPLFSPPAKAFRTALTSKSG